MKYIAVWLLLIIVAGYIWSKLPRPRYPKNHYPGVEDIE